MDQPIEIDVQEYLNWLFKRAPMYRVVQINHSVAIRAARTLTLVAVLADDQERIGRMVSWISSLPVLYGGLQFATPRQCIATLREAARQFGGIVGIVDKNGVADSEYAIGLLQRVKKQDFEDLKNSRIQGRQREYRSTDGSAICLPKGRKQIEELSLRIWDGYCALRESRCPSPSAGLADCLNRHGVKGGDWSSQRVEARLRLLRKRKQVDWSTSPWRFQFWEQRTGKNAGDGEQPFRFVWKKAVRLG